MAHKIIYFNSADEIISWKKIVKCWLTVLQEVL